MAHSTSKKLNGSSSSREQIASYFTLSLVGCLRRLKALVSVFLIYLQGLWRPCFAEIINDNNSITRMVHVFRTGGNIPLMLQNLASHEISLVAQCRLYCCVATASRLIHNDRNRIVRSNGVLWFYKVFFGHLRGPSLACAQPLTYIARCWVPIRLSDLDITLLLYILYAIISCARGRKAS